MSSLIYIEALEIMRRFFLKKDRANPGLFSFIFGLFKQTSLNFLQQINVKKYHVHPVYGTGIWTHDLRNLNLLP